MRGRREIFQRDFTKAKPVDDAAFKIYRDIYAYDKTPLNAMVEPVADPSVDWTRQKITFNTAYGNERMSTFLFLPRNTKPPFQTVVFFPSARVNFLRNSTELGDMDFVDYVIKSGRAVIYPVYQRLYERRETAPTLPGPTLQRDVLVNWRKDLGRSIDYLESRDDIEDRFNLTKPVLMVNGRYDATFPYDDAQVPLFRMLGTPAANKREVVFDTPHDVRLRRTDLVREVLDWFDKYPVESARARR